MSLGPVFLVEGRAIVTAMKAPSWDQQGSSAQPGLSALFDAYNSAHLAEKEAERACMAELPPDASERAFVLRRWIWEHRKNDGNNLESKNGGAYMLQVQAEHVERREAAREGKSVCTSSSWALPGNIAELFDAYDAANEADYDAEEACMAVLPKEAAERAEFIRKWMADNGPSAGAELLLRRADMIARREAATRR